MLKYILILISIIILSCQQTEIIEIDYFNIGIKTRVNTTKEIPTEFDATLTIKGDGLPDLIKVIHFQKEINPLTSDYYCLTPIEIPLNYFGIEVSLSLETTVNNGIWESSPVNVVFSSEDTNEIEIVLHSQNEVPTCEIPTIEPAAGNYTAPLSITISSATEDAVIYYTTDASEPGILSQQYSEEIIIYTSTVLKAIAIKEGYNNSEISLAEYQIANPEAQFIFIPAGSFFNGVSYIEISAFYLANYEVTQAEYTDIMGFNPAFFSTDTSHPVEQVSWFDAVVFCNRKSISDNFVPCYSYLSYGNNPDNWPFGWNASGENHINITCDWSADGYRLPTEMEWMYAASGAINSHGFTYSGSNDVNSVTWYSANSQNITHSGGEKLPNELMLYDMSGNVLEWCWDIFADYPLENQLNPHGADTGNSRILRGGAWNLNSQNCTVFYRDSSNASYGYNYAGFRICRKND